MANVSESVSRRTFATGAVATVTAALAGRALPADEPPHKSESQKPESPGPESPPTRSSTAEHPPGEIPPPPPWEDLQVGALLSRYPGAHLTPEMLDEIHADLRGHRLRAERLRNVELPPGTPPAILFVPFRAADG